MDQTKANLKRKISEIINAIDKETNKIHQLQEELTAQLIILCAQYLKPSEIKKAYTDTKDFYKIEKYGMHGITSRFRLVINPDIAKAIIIEETLWKGKKSFNKQIMIIYLTGTEISEHSPIDPRMSTIIQAAIKRLPAFCKAYKNLGP